MFLAIIYNLKNATNCRSVSACELSSCADAAVSSETAELFCVTFEICASPSLIFTIASACSFEAVEMSSIISETSPELATMASSDLDVDSAMVEPVSTRSIEFCMSVVVSLTAWHFQQSPLLHCT